MSWFFGKNDEDTLKQAIKALSKLLESKFPMNKYSEKDRNKFQKQLNECYLKFYDRKNGDNEQAQKRKLRQQNQSLRNSIEVMESKRFEIKYELDSMKSSHEKIDRELEHEKKKNEALMKQKEKGNERESITKLKDEQISELKGQLESMSKENEQSVLKINALEQKIQSQADMYSKLTTSAEENQQQLTNLKGQLQRLETDNAEGKKALAMKQQEISQLHLKYQNDKQLLQSMIEESKAELQKVSNHEQCIKIAFFVSGSFEYRDPRKYYLIEQIEGLMKMRMRATRILYVLDENNPTNMHDYIDNKPNIVIVFKLAGSGMILGGYSEEALIQNQANKGKGLLFNLDKKKCYELQQNNENSQALVYNDHYIVIGNSQLRIKIGEKSLNSNFGIVMKYFNTKNDTRKDFLGGDEKEFELSTYEVHQVFFDGQ